MESNPHRIYKAWEVNMSSPGKLVSALYDGAIKGCLLRSADQVAQPLTLLIDALDFEQGEVAVGLLRLYQYALESVRSAEFDVPLKILRELRETWNTAIGREQYAMRA